MQYLEDIKNSIRYYRIYSCIILHTLIEIKLLKC